MATNNGKAFFEKIFNMKENKSILIFKKLMIEKQFKVQSVIISTDLHDNAKDAREEALKFVSEDEAKLMKPVDETDQSFRFRIRPPGTFARLRTFSPKDGVSIVGGPLKKEDVKKDLSMQDTEAGSHPHRLERENKKTKKDGAHEHLYVLPDGRIVLTENDGWHEHPLEAEDSNETFPRTGKHKHRIIIDGQEFITEEDKGHDHQTGVRSTVFDGIHFHKLVLNGETLESMMPGQFWVHIGRPHQATNSPNLFMPLGMEKQDISDDKIVALKMLGFSVKENQESIIGEKTVKIIKANEDQQMIFGVVLEEDMIDTQGDEISEEELQETAHNFLEESRIIGFRHFKKAQARLIESVIVHKGDRFYGVDFDRTAWIIGVHVKNAALWKEIKDNKLNSFSVGGFAKRT